ncbi:hypothetical protein M430DRAFT_270156 [Amorphotheca resinae ATCC 22711]|uniref:G-protein coupled receptors family 2 profile 2 domain-containing protein n=1 Tax=Amorphotheca resinae ATCC 22711 TaxID=857342 RepID=A0A2T3AUJ1_AMORE|nr:hypothetical protein M430DRAFT_270156 [Amorphotheca resinae ATCC 22711]PSS12318.1 hypothetical protein M430DRAFT_270156 [Amorphotheca resinae ATCC 22711]
MGGLTGQQVDALIVIERVTACISVIGTLFLITTFILFKGFRTLSNTLIFYASFANLFANIAALIGGSALTKLSSPLCQFQGFLLEMFMQSDPMWSLAMAVNVYLVFFQRFDAIRLKKLYPVYGLLCYGIPFIPAMVCLLYKNGKGDIYGNATLWCWIDNTWAPIRIYSYYAPIWFCILLAIIIYIRVGIEIFQKRSQLRAIGDNVSGTLDSSNSPPEPFSGLRTTEVEVTHDFWNGGRTTRPMPTYNQNEKGSRDPHHYSITISAHDRPSAPSRFAIASRRPSSMDKVKWSYTKVAMLFAISILVTWVPGFWNTVIYFTTSLSVCKGIWARFRGRMEIDAGKSGMLGIVHLGRRDKETDSMVELSTHRDDGSGRDSFWANKQEFADTR